MSSSPSITVLLSCYNGEKYIAQQFDSILAQKDVNLKILCRDDASSDNTREIIRRYQSLHPNIIDYIEGENLGFALSFTELLKTAYHRFPDTEYFSFADQDDVWLPDKLRRGIDYISNNANDVPVTYCSNTDLVDCELNFIRKGRQKAVILSKSKALIRNVATGCTMVFNRKAVELYINHLPQEIKVHDFLMFQICTFLGKVIYDDESRILYRQHTNNQIGSPGFIGRMRRRLKGNFAKSTLRHQNENFLRAFNDLLSPDDIKLISNFVNYHKSIISKLRLLFNSSIRYDSLEANFFLSLKILNGTL